MARDPMAPVDPGTIQDTEIDPSLTLPNMGEPEGGPDHGIDSGDYQFWLRDGYTPYRSQDQSFQVFSKADDAWMYQEAVDPDDMWDSTPNEIAGMIGGQERLTEPPKGGMPFTAQDPLDLLQDDGDDELDEADSTADFPTDATPDDDSDDTLDTPNVSGMDEEGIRAQGMAIDLPYEDPLPVPLKYKDTGQQVWTPPPGWRDGMPPIDGQLASDLGVPRELGDSGTPGATTPDAPADQEGTTDVGSDGGTDDVPTDEPATGTSRRIRRGAV